MSTTYRYRARASDGRVVFGSTRARQIEDVADLLAARSLTPIEIDENLTIHVLRSRAEPKGFASACDSLSVLIDAGVPLKRAVDLVIEGEHNAEVRDMLGAISASLENGSTIGGAFHAEARCSATATAMITAGERSGHAAQALRRYAELAEQKRSLRQRIASTLAYPVIVLCAAIGLLFFLLISILPSFSQTFAALRIDPPFTTQLLFAFSAALTTSLGYSILASGTGIVIAAAIGTAITPAWRNALWERRFSVPVVRDVANKATSAHILRSLSALLEAGIDLVSALELVMPTTISARYTASIAGIIEHVRSGGRLADGFRATNAFPALACALIAVGEASGSVAAMMHRVAERYDREIREDLAVVATVVEPLIIAFVGAITAFVVCSIFLPLYGLIGGIK